MKPEIVPPSVMAFGRVTAIGVTLPGVVAGVKYDGSPVLRLRGCFLAGLATHHSAEPDTLVVRATEDDCRRFVAEAPETYYLTPYYAGHPVVLARLAWLDDAAVRELLRMSWTLTDAKARPRRSSRPPRPH